MDSASIGDERLSEIIDRLLASPSTSAGDCFLLEEAKVILCRPARPTVVIQRDPRMVPAVVSLSMPEASR